MKFNYTAKDQRGEVQSGVVEANSRDTAIATLQGSGLVILRLEEEVEVPWYLKFFQRFGRKANVKELSLFTRQFATLLEAQVPLVDSLRTMFQQIENVALKEAVFEVISSVEAGETLSQAFARHEGIFSRFYVQMVRSAEITGRLQEVFIYLADYYESQSSLTAKVRGALVYPAFVLVLFGIVVTVIVTTVIPQLSRIILELEVEPSTLPIMTQVLFGLSSFLANYGWVAAIVAITSIAGISFYFQSDEGRALIESWILILPLTKELARRVYLTRFAETLSVMISGDIPVAQALEISGDVVGNVWYQEAIHESAEAVRRGELISEALSRFPERFPPLIIQMVAIGERTGRVDELLSRAAKFFAKELERGLAAITELIQPALILVLGVFVALLIGAVIFPIYQIAQTF